MNPWSYFFVALVLLDICVGTPPFPDVDPSSYYGMAVYAVMERVSEPDSSDGLNVAILVAAILAIAAVGIAAIFLCCWYKNRRNPSPNAGQNPARSPEYPAVSKVTDPNPAPRQGYPPVREVTRIHHYRKPCIML